MGTDETAEPAKSLRAYRMEIVPTSRKLGEEKGRPKTPGISAQNHARIAKSMDPR